MLFKLTLNELQKALTLTAFSASTEEKRFYLCGVYVHRAEDGNVYFVSTDGHRLSRYAAAVEDVKEFKPFIIPNDAVKQILAVKPHKQVKGGGEAWLDTENADITASLNNGQLTRISFRPVDGTFPDYNRVLPAPDACSASNPGSPDIGFNVEYLAELGKAVKKAEGLRSIVLLQIQPNTDPCGPMLINTGIEGYTAVLMPCRI